MPRPSVLFRVIICMEEETRAGAERESRDREPETSAEQLIWRWPFRYMKKQNAWDTLELSYSDGREREGSSGRRRWECKGILETSMRPGRKLWIYLQRCMFMCVSRVPLLQEAMVLYSEWFYRPKQVDTPLYLKDTWSFDLSFVGLWKKALKREKRVRGGGV